MTEKHYQCVSDNRQLHTTAMQLIQASCIQSQAEINAETVIPDASQNRPYKLQTPKIPAYETIITMKLGNSLQLKCSNIIQVEKMTTRDKNIQSLTLRACVSAFIERNFI